MKIIRLVKLTFKKEYIDSFLSELNKRKEIIRNFEGCQFLEIWQDKKNPCIVFSHSYWDNEAALNKYRDSDFFKDTWAFTKVKFDDKPQAWTLNCLHRMD